MMPNNQPEMFGAHSDARHPRVAIGVGEINISVDENVPIIRAPRCQNECAQDREFDDEKDAPNHALSQIRNRKSAIRNSKWARLDSNQGPRDYESPALPLSYRPG